MSRAAASLAFCTTVRYLPRYLPTLGRYLGMLVGLHCACTALALRLHPWPALDPRELLVRSCDCFLLPISTSGPVLALRVAPSCVSSESFFFKGRRSSLPASQPAYRQAGTHTHGERDTRSTIPVKVRPGSCCFSLPAETCQCRRDLTPTVDCCQYPGPQTTRRAACWSRVRQRPGPRAAAATLCARGSAQALSVSLVQLA